MACAEFILAEAEKKIVGAIKFSAPLAEFNSSPGAEQTRGGGGQKTLFYLEKEGETFNNRSLS